MGKTPVMLLIFGVILVMLLAFFMMRRRKEKWFSRDITYGKANSIIYRQINFISNRMLNSGR